MGEGNKTPKPSLARGSVNLRTAPSKSGPSSITRYWQPQLFEPLRKAELILMSRKRRHKSFYSFKDAKSRMCNLLHTWCCSGTNENEIFMAIAHVSCKVQSSYKETLRRKQGAITTYFSAEQGPKLEKGFSRVIAGPKSSNSNRGGNSPRGISPDTQIYWTIQWALIQ